MQALTYIKEGVFRLTEKPHPTIQHPKDAIVRVTLSSICTSDLHIKHGSMPKAVPGITVGHEMVGVVEKPMTCLKTAATTSLKWLLQTPIARIDKLIFAETTNFG